MIYVLNEYYYVRSLKEEDLNGSYISWFEDQDVCEYNSHGKFFKNNKWFRDFIANLNTEDKIVWAICHKEDGHVGNVALQEISFINRSAEFSIILGNKGHVGKCLGKMAGKVLVKHGFDKLNLNRIYCGTADTNIAMKKLASSLGMSEEGRRRHHLFLDGRWIDLIEYGLLREEYKLMGKSEK